MRPRSRQSPDGRMKFLNSLNDMSRPLVAGMLLTYLNPGSWAEEAAIKSRNIRNGTKR